MKVNNKKKDINSKKKKKRGAPIPIPRSTVIPGLTKKIKINTGSRLPKKKYR